MTKMKETNKTKWTIILGIVFIFFLIGFARLQPYIENYKAQTIRSDNQNLIQKMLDNTQAQNSFIDSEIKKTLSLLPHAVRIRVAMIHIPPTGILEYDVINAVANEGYNIGEILHNHPMTEWKDFLNDLLLGKCITLKTEDATEQNLKSRMKELKISYMIACPIFDDNHRLLGGLFVNWSDEQPRKEETDSEIKIINETAKKIGKYIQTLN